MKTQYKSIFASKTMWINLIAGILASATYINPELLTAIGFAHGTETKVLTAIGAITAILNIILRSLNGSPVSIAPNAANNTVNKTSI